MKKVLLIGTVVCVGCLLLMPDISALEQKTIGGTGTHGTITRSEVLHSVQTRDLMKKGNETVFPLLFAIVEIMFFFRLYHGVFLLNLSASWNGSLPQVKLPLVYLRGAWLEITAMFWYLFWADLSSLSGWNWDWPDPYLQ